MFQFPSNPVPSAFKIYYQSHNDVRDPFGITNDLSTQGHFHIEVSFSSINLAQKQAIEAFLANTSHGAQPFLFPIYQANLNTTAIDEGSVGQITSISAGSNGTSKLHIRWNPDQIKTNTEILAVGDIFAFLDANGRYRVVVCQKSAVVYDVDHYETDVYVSPSNLQNFTALNDSSGYVFISNAQMLCTVDSDSGIYAQDNGNGTYSIQLNITQVQDIGTSTGTSTGNQQYILNTGGTVPTTYQGTPVLNVNNELYIWDADTGKYIKAITKITINTDDIADKAISLSKFSDGLEFITTLDTVPTKKYTTYISVGNVLYHWDSSAGKYTNEVQASSVVGQIVSQQVADGALTKAKFAQGIEPVSVLDSIPTTKSTQIICVGGITYSWNETDGKYEKQIPTAAELAALVDTSVKDASITTAKFAQGIEPVSVVSALPTTKLTSLVFYNSGLYRWNGTSYIQSITASLIVGQLVAGQISAGAIGADQIATNAITSAKIASQAITTEKIAANAITAALIAAGVITSDKISANAITTALIAAGAITSDQIAANAVNAAKIAAGSITSDKIAANAIIASLISAGAITSDKIAANAITAALIAAGAITADKLAANIITAAQLAITDFTNICTNNKGGALDGWIGSIQYVKPGAAIFWNDSYGSKDCFNQTGRDSYFGNLFTVSSGEQHYFEFVSNPMGSGSSLYKFGVGLRYLDKNKNTITWSLAAWRNVGEAGQLLKTGSVSAPANTAYAQIWVQIDTFTDLTGVYGGTHHFTNLVCRKKNNGALIVDGSILANHIAASTITGDKIAGNTISGDKILANTIQVANLATGILQADNVLTRGAQVRDNNGNIILASGIGLSAGYLGCGIGTNLIPNSSFTKCQQGQWSDGNDKGGWRYHGGYLIGSDNYGCGLNSNWSLSGGSTIYMHQAGRLGNTNGYMEIFNTVWIPVEPNARYCLSGYLGSHRCESVLFVYVYDSSDNLIQAAFWSTCSDGEASGGNMLSAYKRAYTFQSMPSNASKVFIVLRKYDTSAGNTDSWLFATNVQLEKVPDLATVPGAYNEGGIQAQMNKYNISTYMSSAAIGTAYLQDAIITNAKIADLAVDNSKIANLAVDTLKVAGNAITIPSFNRNSNSYSTYNGQPYTNIWSVNFTTDQPCNLIIDWMARVNYANWANLLGEAAIRVNGYAANAPDFQNRDTPLQTWNMKGNFYCGAAGTYTITIWWHGSDGMYISDQCLTLFGAKK